jgi:cysteine desulfurase
MFGGSQERGLRPGTLAVPLIAGFGKAAELSIQEGPVRVQRCQEFRHRLLEGLAPLQFAINGDPQRSISCIVSISIPEVDAETAIDAWQEIVAISHGAACTSQTYTCSHVLNAMGLPAWQQDGALRLSWCHTTPLPDFQRMRDAIDGVRGQARSVSS